MGERSAPSTQDVRSTSPIEGLFLYTLALWRDYRYRLRNDPRREWFVLLATMLLAITFAALLAVNARTLVGPWLYAWSRDPIALSAVGAVAGALVGAGSQRVVDGWRYQHCLSILIWSPPQRLGLNAVCVAAISVVLGLPLIIGLVAVGGNGWDVLALCLSMMVGGALGMLVQGRPTRTRSGRVMALAWVGLAWAVALMPFKPLVAAALALSFGFFAAAAWLPLDVGANRSLKLLSRRYGLQLLLRGAPAIGIALLAATPPLVITGSYPVLALAGPVWFAVLALHVGVATSAQNRQQATLETITVASCGALVYEQLPAGEWLLWLLLLWRFAVWRQRWREVPGSTVHAR